MQNEIIIVTVSSYGARWVRDIKENQICLSKQQRKDVYIYTYMFMFILRYLYISLS